MDKAELSFSGDVDLSHEQTSVQDLVSQLISSGTNSSNVEDGTPLVIPSLQREFCWKTEDIEQLFDSLLRGLPIGSLLIWDAINAQEGVEKEAKYGFIRDYANKPNFPSEQAEESVNHYSSRLTTDDAPEEYMFVLDGQQRLTSFLLGLKGSFYEHRYRKHTDKINSYYQKYLCINLLNDPGREPDDAQEPIFEFEFRRKGRQGYEEDTEDYWWPVNNIWDEFEDRLVKKVDLPEECIQDQDYRENASANISRLRDAITAEQIPYEVVSGMRSEDALELFIRRNKGGEELKNSDIAFSLITVYWEKFDEDEDPKKIFEDKASELTNQFANYSFSFGKDFLIRSLLYLDDERPSFERDNLVPETIKPLEKYWRGPFFDAISMSFNLLTKDFGLTGKCIGQKTSILPILYYCYDGIDEEQLRKYSDIPVDDRRRMEYWVEMTVLNNIFSISSSMSVLDNTREIINDSIHFPVSDVVTEYQGRSVTIGVTSTEDDPGITIANLVNETDHSSATTVRNYLLTKLYDDRGVGRDFETDDGEVTSIEVDHFFPASKLRNNENYLDNQDFELSEAAFNEMKSFCENHVNEFGNFTLLPHGSGNQSKGEKDPEKWLDEFDTDEEVEQVKERHHLPDVDSYSYNTYDIFLESRKQTLIRELEDKIVLSEEI